MTEMTRCISPIDGSVYLERPVATAKEIEAALSAARNAQTGWSTLSIAERAQYCTAIVDNVLAMEADITPELAWQMGRPVRFCAGELRGFEERARHMIAIAEAALAPIEPAPVDGARRFIERVPMGVVFIIAPWNYPYLTAVNSLIPALMAGNTVILKHAAQTLGVGERLQAACDKAGLPAGVFKNLFLTHEQSAAMIASNKIDQVNFTGSVSGGRAISTAAAKTFMGVGLELGGKDPAYVREDADIVHAIENLVDGAYFNSGQSCCGIERIYVSDKIYQDFVDGFVERTRAYVLGSPLEGATTLGPMVKPAAADFVRRQINSAVSSGACALINVKDFKLDAPGSSYMAPQALIDVDHSMTMMVEESFGPVVGIMKVRDDDEAVRLMNDSAYGLSASIWTADLECAQKLGGEIETGTVFMNRCDYLDPALAWTGVKNTGRGATLSAIGYSTLTRPKSFHLKHQI
jgi:acyl-CoA reductase-like NAD-dependent aldehyde dehydrogenase